MCEKAAARRVMEAADMARALELLAADILKAHADDSGSLALIGIQRRGVFLAERLGAALQRRLGRVPDAGSLDISLYRDDWTTLGPRAIVGNSSLAFEVTGRPLILVDDVLYTGRTIRAALEALADFGRPGKVELLALVDRGGRELPIQADFVGIRVDAGREERVDVLLAEQDGRDEVLIRAE